MVYLFRGPRILFHGVLLHQGLVGWSPYAGLNICRWPTFLFLHYSFCKLVFSSQVHVKVTLIFYNFISPHLHFPDKQSGSWNKTRAVQKINRIYSGKDHKETKRYSYRNNKHKQKQMYCFRWMDSILVIVVNKMGKMTSWGSLKQKGEQFPFASCSSQVCCAP